MTLYFPPTLHDTVEEMEPIHRHDWFRYFQFAVLALLVALSIPGHFLVWRIFG